MVAAAVAPLVDTYDATQPDPALSNALESSLVRFFMALSCGGADDVCVRVCVVGGGGTAIALRAGRGATGDALRAARAAAR
jgi:hypothetical protein